jgi:hypothetical protein
MIKNVSSELIIMQRIENIFRDKCLKCPHIRTLVSRCCHSGGGGDQLMCCLLALYHF